MKISKKAIIKMACNENVMYHMLKIQHISENMCYADEYEKVSREREMKRLASFIADLLEEGEG